MPCEPIIQNGKAVGFICSRTRGKSKPPPCYKCGKPSTKLCDFRNYGTRKWKDDYGRERVTEYAGLDTCDKPMCDECTNHMGNDTDYCDEHNNQLVIHKTKQGERVHHKRLKELGITEEAPDEKPYL